MNKNVAFTIVAKNYIGLALILEESLKEKNPETDFYIIVADEITKESSISSLPKNILIARNVLGIPESQWIDMSFKYDLTEFCTSIKPATFSYFLEETSYDKIIYFDPDIYIYNTLDPIFNVLDTHSIVVTPHIAIIQDEYSGDLVESSFLGSGVFNFGFCAIKNDAIAKKMISWWHNRLIDKCYIDNFNNFMTDQKWMDFLPCFFNSSELFVTNHLGMNIAPWNFYERKVFYKDGVLMVCDRNKDELGNANPVTFVHYSGFDYKELKKGVVVQNNISKLRNYDDIAILTEFYAKAIHSKRDVFDSFISQNYSYSKFNNGDSIMSFHRRLYRSLIDKGEVIYDPYETSSGNYFHTRLKKNGMIKKLSLTVEKTNRENLNGVESKLKMFSLLSRFFYKVIGLERYLLLLRLLKPFSRYESQIHLLDKKYDKENIWR